MTIPDWVKQLAFASREAHFLLKRSALCPLLWCYWGRVSCWTFLQINQHCLSVYFGYMGDTSLSHWERGWLLWSCPAVRILDCAKVLWESAVCHRVTIHELQAMLSIIASHHSLYKPNSLAIDFSHLLYSQKIEVCILQTAGENERHAKAGT